MAVAQEISYNLLQQQQIQQQVPAYSDNVTMSNSSIDVDSNRVINADEAGSTLDGNKWDDCNEGGLSNEAQTNQDEQHQAGQGEMDGQPSDLPDLVLPDSQLAWGSADAAASRKLHSPPTAAAGGGATTAFVAASETASEWSLTSSEGSEGEGGGGYDGNADGKLATGGSPTNPLRDPEVRAHYDELMAGLEQQREAGAGAQTPPSNAVTDVPAAAITTPTKGKSDSSLAGGVGVGTGAGEEEGEREEGSICYGDTLIQVLSGDGMVSGPEEGGACDTATAAAASAAAAAAASGSASEREYIVEFAGSSVGNSSCGSIHHSTSMNADGLSALSCGGGNRNSGALFTCFGAGARGHIGNMSCYNMSSGGKAAEYSKLSATASAAAEAHGRGGAYGGIDTHAAAAGTGTGVADRGLPVGSAVGAASANRGGGGRGGQFQELAAGGERELEVDYALEDPSTAFERKGLSHGLSGILGGIPLEFFLQQQREHEEEEEMRRRFAGRSISYTVQTAKQDAMEGEGATGK